MNHHYTRLPADFVDRLSDLLCTVRTEQILMRTSGEADRLQRIVRLAVTQTHAEVGMLLLVHEDRGDLQIAAAYGAPVDSLHMQFVSRVGLTGFAIDEGNPVAMADRPNDQHRGLRDEIDERTGLRTRSLLAVPLLVHGQPCGALELRNTNDERGFGPGAIELCTELAYLASAAVEEYRGDRFLFALFASALPYALDTERGREGDELTAELERWLAELRQCPGWRQQIELAVRVRDLCRFGDDAVHVAQTILEALLAREKRRKTPLGTPC